MVDVAQYEGAFVDVPEPGYYVASTKAGVDVVKVPAFKLEGNKLLGEYQIIASGITEEDAETLILDVILGEFMDHYYRPRAEKIELVNLNSGARRSMPYPV